MNDHSRSAARRTHCPVAVKLGRRSEGGGNLRRMGMGAQVQFVDDAKVTYPSRVYCNNQIVDLLCDYHS